MGAADSEARKGFRPVLKSALLFVTLPSAPSEKLCRIRLRTSHLNRRRGQHASTPFSPVVKSTDSLAYSGRWAVSHKRLCCDQKVPGQKVRAVQCSRTWFCQVHLFVTGFHSKGWRKGWLKGCETGHSKHLIQVVNLLLRVM